MPYDITKNTFDSPMQDIIEKYASLNQEYENKCEDAAHWYTEGTCTALFSVAAWQCGYPAICETSSIKQVLNGRPGRPAHSNGRVDLFFYDCDGSGLWIEAKKVPGSMDVSEQSDYPASKARLERWFGISYDSAAKNRREAHEYEGKIGCLVFCSFSLRREYYADANCQQRRAERAKHVNEVLQRVVDEDEGECSFASFFDTSETEIVDEFEYRAFGFAVLGFFEDA